MNTPRVVFTLVFAAVFCAVMPLSAAAQVGIPYAVDIGLEVENFEYNEPNVMSEEGTQYGIYGAYTGYFMQNIMAHAFLSYVGGDLDYDGGLQFADGSSLATTATTPNTIFNFRLAAGYRIPVGGADITPYVGYGYRNLENEITDELTIKATGETGTAPCAGYQRDQKYSYIPLGVQLVFGSTWGVEAVGEYDFFLSGENHSYRPECGMDNTFDQDDGSGYRFSVKIISPPVIGSMKIVVEPFYEHWEVDDSNVVNGFLEPENDASSTGIRIGGRF
jgi:hypothetical protein